MAMIKKGDDLLGSLIHDVAHLLRFEIDKRLEPHNLTRVKWLALGIIQRNPSLTQAELSEKMELGAASVGRLVDRLVERGFVTRETDEADRRSYRLHLTDSAQDVLQEIEGMADQLREETFEPLSPSEISHLNKSLGKLKRSLKARATAVIAMVSVSIHKVALSSESLLGLTPLL